MSVRSFRKKTITGVELPTTPNNLLLQPPSRAKAREASARKVLCSPAAIRKRTPRGYNRQELEDLAVQAYLFGPATIDHMAVTIPGYPTRFVGALLEDMVRAERAS